MVQTSKQLGSQRYRGPFGRSSEDLDVERYDRDPPLMCIGEGTNEMQPIIIARPLVERHPA